MPGTKTNLIEGEYKIFGDTYYEQMPSIIQEGFRPFNSKDIMEYRIKAAKSKMYERTFWLRDYWDTVDGLAYTNYKEGTLIVIPNSEELLCTNNDFKPGTGWNIELSQERYKELGEKYGVIERGKIKLEELTKKEAKEHPIWLKLAQDDKVVLSEYVDLMFSKFKRVKGMGIYISPEWREEQYYYSESPLLSYWCHRGLQVNCGVYSECLLNSDHKIIGIKQK